MEIRVVSVCNSYGTLYLLDGAQFTDRAVAAAIIRTAMDKDQPLELEIRDVRYVRRPGKHETSS